jgi:Bax protein
VLVLSLTLRCNLLILSRFRTPFLLALLGVATVLPGSQAPVSGPVVLPPATVAAVEIVAPAPHVAADEALSAQRLKRAFGRYDYDLDTVADGGKVPALVVSKVPRDLDQTEPDTRKDVFFSLMLPLVLVADEAVAGDRRRLEDMATRERRGEALTTGDTAWLDTLAESYDVPTGPRLVERLLPHVDVVPPSLALAQAAIESGWGTSRLARRRNNLFGQNLEDDGVVVGQARFATLLDAVHSYVHNLNTHRAYAGFRSARAQARARGRLPDGANLATTLTAYSELGRDYTSGVRSVIRNNDLTRLDRARLASRTAGI